jgi:hypothetical protein
VAKCYKPPKWHGAIESPGGGIALPMPHIKFGGYRRLVDKGLVPVTMFPKTDQNFERFATPWEIIYSKLISP